MAYARVSLTHNNALKKGVVYTHPSGVWGCCGRDGGEGVNCDVCFIDPIIDYHGWDVILLKGIVNRHLLAIAIQRLSSLC